MERSTQSQIGPFLHTFCPAGSKLQQGLSNSPAKMGLHGNFKTTSLSTLQSKLKDLEAGIALVVLSIPSSARLQIH